MPDDPSDIITINEACRIMGGAESPIHPATLWRWVKAGRVSPPLRIGPKTVRFKRSVLLAERDAKTAGVAA